MIYNPRDVLPLALKGVDVSSRNDLYALGVDNLQRFRQYWQEQKEKYLQDLDNTRKIIEVLDGKTAAEIKAMAEKDNTAFCNCNKCIYGQISRLIGDQKPHISCSLIPMFVDTDGNGPFLYIENTSAPLCGIANASSDDFIKICVKYLNAKCEIIKRSYNHANDCLIYLDSIIRYISRTPA